jgi:anti-sigma28 factor (negative regulator of flagellin synthesis)
MAAIHGIGTTAALESVALPAAHTNEAAAAKSSTANTKVGAAATANVSSTGGLVAQALSTSDVRLDKVTALQQSIESHSYSVSSNAVASKIVDSLLS